MKRKEVGTSSSWNSEEYTIKMLLQNLSHLNWPFFLHNVSKLLIDWATVVRQSNISSHCSAMFLCRTSPVVNVEHMYRQTVSKTPKTDDYYQAGLHKWQLATLNKRSKPIIYCTNRWWHSSCISMVPLFSGSSVEENVFFSFAAGPVRQFSQWKVSRKTEKISMANQLFKIDRAAEGRHTLHSSSRLEGPLGFFFLSFRPFVSFCTRA